MTVSLDRGHRRQASHQADAVLSWPTPNLMLLDDFLPEFDVRTHHAIRVAAPPEHVYRCVRSTNFDHWGITRALYALRFFFFIYTATTEIYTLSLHDALPIFPRSDRPPPRSEVERPTAMRSHGRSRERSEEHTSELQSRPHLVCRLLLEKKTNNQKLGHTNKIKKIIS